MNLTQLPRDPEQSVRTRRFMDLVRMYLDALIEDGTITLTSSTVTISSASAADVLSGRVFGVRDGVIFA